MDIKKIRDAVIEHRFSDAQKAYTSCLQILTYVKQKQDPYSEVFAYTYLGDYYIGRNDTNHAFQYLLKAKKLAEENKDCSSLRPTIYSFLGIAYEMDGDEQHAIMNYLDGMSIAREHHNRYVESINLNNLAVVFQRHKHWKKALEYSLLAYDVQKDLSYFPSRFQLLCNIGDLYLQTGELDKALQFYNDCEAVQENAIQREFFHNRNQCIYFAEINEKQHAMDWAEKIFYHVEYLNNYITGAFDNFYMLCLAMFKIKERTFSLQALTLLETLSSGNIYQLQLIAHEKLKYTLQFEDEEKHERAYYTYYCKMQEFKHKTNQEIVKSMKDQIILDEVSIEKNLLEQQQKNLEKEANIDDTTGIFNRRYYELILRSTILKGNQEVGAIMLDIDYFKEYNDSYGHGEGDKALQIVGDCLRAQGKDGIRPFRFGGDEFICICIDTTLEVMEAYIDNVRKDLYQRFVKHEYSLCSDRMTLSIGYVHVKMNTIALCDLVSLADEALYESKLAGRNRVKKKEVKSL